MAEPSDIEEPETHEIVVDWEAFATLENSEKRSLIRLCEQLDERAWFSRIDRPGKAWAFINLNDYRDYDGYVRKLKKISAAFYEGRKSEKRGYYTKFFDRQTFIGDIVTINMSAAARQGRPMSAPYLRTVEEQGGYATQIVEPTPPRQTVSWTRHFGTLRAEPGHRQGELVVNEKLLSYMVIRRLGNAAIYNTIIGHHDHLREGIVYKMHLDFVRLSFEARNGTVDGVESDTGLRGLNYIFYAAYFGNQGLSAWKRHTLFRPGIFSLDFSPALTMT